MILALLLLIAAPDAAAADAPESVTIVARPKSGPGFFARAKQQASAALHRLWEREEPHAAEGNARAAANDPKGALEAYDEAAPNLRDDSPAGGALALDRSSALLKQEASEAPKALEQANHALEVGDAQTKKSAAYNFAYGLEQAGKPDEAIAAYARALALDPDDRDSKVNLELLLRAKQQKKGAPGEKKDEKKKQSEEDKEKQEQKNEKKEEEKKQKDEKKEGENKEAQKKEEQQKPEEKPGEKKEQRPEEKQPQAEAPKDEKKEEAQKASARPVDRTEAQRLLDALRASEKNLQVWRFGQRRKEMKRSDVEKDW